MTITKSLIVRAWTLTCRVEDDPGLFDQLERHDALMVAVVLRRNRLAHRFNVINLRAAEDVIGEDARMACWAVRNQRKKVADDEEPLRPIISRMLRRRLPGVAVSEDGWRVAGIEVQCAVFYGEKTGLCDRLNLLLGTSVSQTVVDEVCNWVMNHGRRPTRAITTGSRIHVCRII